MNLVSKSLLDEISLFASIPDAYGRLARYIKIYKYIFFFKRKYVNNVFFSNSSSDRWRPRSMVSSMWRRLCCCKWWAAWQRLKTMACAFAATSTFAWWAILASPNLKFFRKKKVKMNYWMYLTNLKFYLVVETCCENSSKRVRKKKQRERIYIFIR